MTGTSRRADPTWQLVLEAAEELTRIGQSPFRRAVLVERVRALDPDRLDSTLGPVIQGMTEGATGGPQARCGRVLRRITRGTYVLIPMAERSSAATARPSPPQRERRQDAVEARVRGLVAYFDTYVEWYDATVPFVRTGQYELQRATIDRRYELGSVGAAVTDPAFVDLLHRTLQAWGIGRRASRLMPLPEFTEALKRSIERLTALERLRIEDAGLDRARVIADVGDLVTDLPIVDNVSRVVPATKTLHHLLRELVPPMDRAWTGLFFKWSAPQVRDGQSRPFTTAFGHMIEVAQAVQP
jgi:hypothetical protein